MTWSVFVPLQYILVRDDSDRDLGLSFWLIPSYTLCDGRSAPVRPQMATGPRLSGRTINLGASLEHLWRRASVASNEGRRARPEASRRAPQATDAPWTSGRAWCRLWNKCR